MALCQDTQAEAYDYPESFFAERVLAPRRIRPDEGELAEAVALLRNAQEALHRRGRRRALFAKPRRQLADFASAPRHSGGRNAGRQIEPCPRPSARNLGSIGVTGTGAANALAEEADVILAVGTRLQDFTTGSWALFKNPQRRIVGLNVQAFDATKHTAQPLVADARVGIEELVEGACRLEGAMRRGPQKRNDEKTRWTDTASRYTDADQRGTALRRAGHRRRAARIAALRHRRGAAGGLPGELHKLWNASQPLGYHMEYGYSCMGYEIAGGLGVKMAEPTAKSSSWSAMAPI